MKTYSQMNELPTYEERLSYLRTRQRVGEDTFGWNRYINQKFYCSAKWRNVRNRIIARDNGCDMGLPGCPITGKILIHHIEPITEEDLLNFNPKAIDPENLVCVSYETHQAIHWESEPRNPYELKERKPGDTKLWSTQS